VYFENGAIIYAASNQEKFRLGSILIYRNRISSAQWQALERVMIQQGEKFGRVAVQENVISEEELRDFLKIQVSEIIYDTFLWQEGKFSFIEMLQLPEHAVTISIDLTNLIMEGARRIDEWEHCAQLIPDKHAVLRVIAS